MKRTRASWPGSCRPLLKVSLGLLTWMLCARVSALCITSVSPGWRAISFTEKARSLCVTAVSAAQAAPAATPTASARAISTERRPADSGFLVIGQSLEKGDEVGTLRLRQRNTLEVVGERCALDDAIGVMIDHRAQARQRAVMHVGRPATDIAQARRLERVGELRHADDRPAAGIGCARQAGVVEGVVGEAPGCVAGAA